MINLLGLSTGLACFFLIYLWVNEELHVDTFHEKDAQLYQVMQNFRFPQGTQTWEYTPGPLVEAFASEMPEVKEAAHTGNRFYRPEGILSLDDRHFEMRGLIAIENFFDVFTYVLLAGNSEDVLKGRTTSYSQRTSPSNFLGPSKKRSGERWSGKLVLRVGCAFPGFRNRRNDAR
jgi:hypothetical protein